MAQFNRVSHIANLKETVESNYNMQFAPRVSFESVHNAGDRALMHRIDRDVIQNGVPLLIDKCEKHMLQDKIERARKLDVSDAAKLFALGDAFQQDVPVPLRTSDYTILHNRQGKKTPACASTPGQITLIYVLDVEPIAARASTCVVIPHKYKAIATRYFSEVFGHNLKLGGHFAELATLCRTPFNVYVMDVTAGDLLVLPPGAVIQVQHEAAYDTIMQWTVHVSVTNPSRPILPKEENMSCNEPAEPSSSTLENSTESQHTASHHKLYLRPTRQDVQYAISKPAIMPSMIQGSRVEGSAEKTFKPEIKSEPHSQTDLTSSFCNSDELQIIEHPRQSAYDPPSDVVLKVPTQHNRTSLRRPTSGTLSSNLSAQRTLPSSNNECRTSIPSEYPDLSYETDLPWSKYTKSGTSRPTSLRPNIRPQGQYYGTLFDDSDEENKDPILQHNLKHKPDYTAVLGYKDIANDNKRRRIDAQRARCSD